MKKQKLIIVFLIAIMMILVSANEVKAATRVTFSELENGRNLYCIAGGAHLKDSMEVRAKRNVTTTVNGVTTTKTEYEYVEAGIRNYYSASGIKTISSSFKSTKNERIAAYLLYKGAGYNSSVQGVIWHHTGVFTKALRTSVTANGDARSRKGDNRALYNEAVRQAEEKGASISLGSGIKQASSKTQTDGTKVGEKEESIEDYKVGATSDETNIKSDVVESFKVAASSSKSAGKATITTENYKVGPMSVKYNGTIDKVTLEYTDGSKTDKVQIEQDGKTFTDVSKIKSNTNFYLINKTEKQVSKVKIHVFKKHKYQKVKYRTLRGSYTKADLPSGWTYVSGKYNSPQSLLKIEKVEEKTENTEKEFTFNLKVKKGDLELIKIGTYGIDGETKTEKLEGMKFKVYCNTLEKWVKQVGDEVTFGEFKEAQEFTTDANGVISIKGLYAAGFGNENYVYTLVETEGNKGYYIDPIRISKTSSDIKEDQDQKIGHMQIDGKNYCTIENVTVFSKNTNKIEITDDRTSGDLVIEKRDYTIENDKSIEDKLKLQGAQFKIKLVKSEAQFDEKGGLDEKGKYIENKWLMSNDKGTYDYVDLTHDKYLTGEDDPSKAGIFETDENGKIEIKGIVNGTYEIYEVKAPKGYDITKQEGYDPEKQWVNCGEVNISTKENKVTYKILNKKIITKLEGFVWIDGQPKGDKYDYIYKDGSNDKLLDLDKDIDVELRKVDGTLLATTKTVNGRYEFTKTNKGEDIYYWDLINSYVLFKYDNDTYIAVDPFTGKELPINSKAQEYQITAPKLNDQTIKDKKDNAYPGEAVTYKSSKTINDYKEILENNKNISSGNYSSDTLKTTPLTGYYNEDNYTVEHINLGLMPKEKPTASVKTHLAYSKVNMNGFKYRYNYDEVLPGTTGQQVDPIYPTEQEQVSKKYYIGKVYPSDIIAYQAKNADLAVYIVYRIDIFNTTPTEGDPNLYKEERMYINDLKVTDFAGEFENTEGKKRNYFEIDTTQLDNDLDPSEQQKTISAWSEDGTLTNEAKNTINKDGIEAGKCKSVYVQFKMKDDLLDDFINKKVKEITPFKTTLNAYHEYLRTDNVWDENGSVKQYEGARQSNYPDRNEQTNKKYFVHRSIDIDEKCNNLYLKFNLPEKQRTISGTVFEDTATKENLNGNKNLGDGIYDNQENTVKTVKVDLVTKTENDTYETAKLYQLDKNDKVVRDENGNIKTGTAVVEKGTEQDGTYKFEGVIPGYYYVRFTYGNGTQKIVDTNQKEIDNVNSVEYKSTIITDGSIKNAMEAKDYKVINYVGSNMLNDENKEYLKKAEWYKYTKQEDINNFTRYSTAVDDTKQRADIEKEAYNDNEYKLNEKKDNKDINAYTPKTGISIENDQNLAGNENINEFSNFNFGIITFPKTEITPVKEITNVKLTNQVGTVMTTGNPVDEPQYISDLSKLSKTGTTSAKAELDPNLIHGTQLETTYKITITNNSQYDYVTVNEDGTIANDNYYKYGETNDQELKGVEVTEVEDYIDKKYKTNVEDLKDISSKIEELQKDGTLKVTSEKTNIEFKKKASETTGDQTSESTTTENTQQNSEGSTTTTKTDTLSVKGWSRLKVGESQTVEYTAVATIASTADDLVYENQARVVSMKLDKLIELNAISENNDYWQKTDNTIITIVPNTGKDKSNTYWIAGTIALIVLGAGFVILKKKVLK